MKTFIGIDYGSKRIGVAVGDDQTKIVHSLMTLENDVELFKNLRQLVADHEAAGLVVGLPRGLDGQETKQTALVRAFAAELGQLELPIELQDEAATSELAREQLGPTAAKGDIDAASAGIILQDYLDNL